MDEDTAKNIIKLYRDGHSLRQISKVLHGTIGRERVRQLLHASRVGWRGRGAKSRPPQHLTSAERTRLAELLGYLYGDGHLTRNKNGNHGLFDCVLTFAANEPDLVERALTITEDLYGFRPRVKKYGGWTCVKFRRSFAKYLQEIGYPAGKKSMCNPRAPLDLLPTKEDRVAFIRGFLNAEASVHKSVFVHQSVRISATPTRVARARAVGKNTILKGKPCTFVAWSAAAEIFADNTSSSRILTDLSTLLRGIGIPSTVKPIRAYIGFSGVTSVHFELRIRRQHLKTVADLRLVDSTKKQEKLNQLLRG